MVQLTDKFFAVEVPDDAANLVVHNMGTYSKVVFTSTLQDPFGCGGDAVYMPRGSYQFLFTTKEATWEQAEMVVEKINGWYKDYAGDIGYSDPGYSLQSLLSVNGCNLRKNYAIIQTTTNE